MKQRVIFLTIALCLVITSMSFASNNYSKLADFPVYFNGELIDNSSAAYPLLVYQDITYFPMTWDYSSGLGLTTKYTNSQGLVIRKSGQPSPLKQTRTAVNDYSKTYIIQMPDFPITVNGKIIDNSTETYPIFTFRGITYFPLTWHYVVDEFGWESAYSNESGLRIKSLKEADSLDSSTPDTITDTQDLTHKNSTTASDSKTYEKTQNNVTEVESETVPQQEKDAELNKPSVERVTGALELVKTSVGNEVYLPNQVEVKMSDGEQKHFKILWNQGQLNGSSYENYYNAVSPGRYTIDGVLYLHEYFDVSIDVLVYGKVEFENPGIKAIVERRLYNKSIDNVTIDDLELYENLDIRPSDYNISNFNGIGILPNIKELNLRGNCQNIDFSGLQELDQLRSLKINKPSTEKIHTIFNIDSLEHLEIYTQGDLSDLNGIENLVNLKTLILKNYIEDPSALEEIKDRVEITWMRKTYEETLKLNTEVFEVEAKNNQLEENQKHAEAVAKDIADSIIRAGMSDEEKVIAIQNYIVKNVRYDHNNFNNNTVPREAHTLYGALVNKSAVCDGFAYAFDAIANHADLETQIIRGNVFSTVETNIVNHAWNLVNVNGVYKHVDTSSDSLKSASEPIRYNYTLKSDLEIGLTHQWDTSRYPVAE